MQEYKKQCIDNIKINLNDLKDTKNPVAAKAAINEIKFYISEIEARL